MTTLSLSASSREALESWLVRQRWFGEKSRRLVSLQADVVNVVDLADGAVAMVIGRCHFDEGLDSVYFMPIRVARFGDDVHLDGDAVIDAFLSERFLDWLAAGFSERRVLETDHGYHVRWQTEGDFPSIGGGSRLLGAEQSNTSILFGRQAIGKVFRKLQPGVNPDPEIVGFLSRSTAFTNAPRLLGQVTSTGPDGDVVMAAVQSFVPNQGDAWTWLLSRLSTLAEIGVDRLIDDIRLLGQRTGELHAALASSNADPSFAPEPLTTSDVDALGTKLGEELTRTISILRQTGIRRPDRLDDLEKVLESRLALSDVLGGYPKTRVHGDYHLGQVLRTEDDFVIIDFEGEPSRAIDERREKTSPLKDVAGMLRSLDYAVATVEARMERLTNEIEFREWGKAARWAFVTGYIAALERMPRPLIPLPGSGFELGLDAYLIEKALYEVRYELDNRPDWVEIPLRALEEAYLNQ